MDTTASATVLTCTQCGGELHPDEGQVFLFCPYCSSAVYVDKSRVVFHWSVAPTLNEAQATGALMRWMSGSQTVKDLDKKSRVTGSSFEYFPLWYFKWKSQRGEETALEPAAAISITELKKLRLPAGDLQKYDSALDSKAVEPSVPLDAARQWFLQNHAGAEAAESAIVHIPIYIFKYQYKGQTYTAVVEAATGATLANVYPSKPEAPYFLAALVTGGFYLLMAVLGLTGDLTAIALILSCLGAPVLFTFAAWVANKV